MITSKLIKFELKAHVLIEEDKLSIAEIITTPIFIYRGNELDYEEFIREIERVTLQKFKDGRSGEN